MAKARIAVVGAGLMGHGIAQAFAVAGHEALRRGIRSDLSLDAEPTWRL